MGKVRVVDRLYADERKRINRLLSDLPNHWDKPGDALVKIAGALAQHGFELADTVSFLERRNDSQTYRPNIARSNPADPSSPWLCANSCLRISVYYFSTTGRYEVTTYVS